MDNTVCVNSKVRPITFRVWLYLLVIPTTIAFYLYFHKGEEIMNEYYFSKQILLGGAGGRKLVKVRRNNYIFLFIFKKCSHFFPFL